jgi:hypothetical protein
VFDVAPPRLAQILRLAWRSACATRCDIAERQQDLARKAVPEGYQWPAKPERRTTTATCGRRHDTELVAGVWLGRQGEPIKKKVVGSYSQPDPKGTNDRYYAGRSSNGWGPPRWPRCTRAFDQSNRSAARRRRRPDKRYVEYFIPALNRATTKQPWKVTNGAVVCFNSGA